MSDTESPNKPNEATSATDNAGVKPEANAGSEEKGEQLTLKVTDNTTEVFFRVRKNTALKRVIDGFCKRTGKDRSSLRFLYEGERVQDDDTPESLEMENDDVIEVLNQQIGGSS